MNPSDISIIVPVHDGGRNWARCLDALLALEPPPGEIVVVDDGSTDDSRAAAVLRGMAVLQTEHPRSGPAVARNLGARHARGEILFFLDADVLVQTDAVARVVRAFDDQVSAIFGSYDDAPDSPAFVSQYKNLQHHYVHQTSSERATSLWAGCGAIKAEVFWKLGGFSSAYSRPSIEDIELGSRLRRAGGQIRLVKDLHVKHLKRWAWRSWLISDFRDRALPWAELIVRERQLPADLNLQMEHRLSAVLCWALVATGVSALWVPVLWLLVGVGVGALVALNLNFYRFLADKRGVWFAVRAMPLHWFYYMYSSAALGWVLVTNVVSKRAINGARDGSSQVATGVVNEAAGETRADGSRASEARASESNLSQTEFAS